MMFLNVVSTVLVNGNPLLRFDGYYILSDLLGVPNLQERSFRLGRWGLRRLLFAWPAPEPADVAPALRRPLILFAWTTWLVRAAVFLGIALLIYHALPKVLGLAVLGLEVVLVLPVVLPLVMALVVALVLIRLPVVMVAML